jgi:hypothetical protein
MRPALYASLAAALGAGACKIDLDKAIPDAGSMRACKVSQATVCQTAEAEQRSDFAWLQQNMFSTNCSGDDCHGEGVGGQPPGGKLVFATGFAYKSLLGKEPTDPGPAPLVATEFDPNHKLVEPGVPNASYMLFLLRHYRTTDASPAFVEPPDDIGYMPQSNSTLCCQKLDAVERWIAAGALP